MQAILTAEKDVSTRPRSISRLQNVSRYVSQSMERGMTLRWSSSFEHAEVYAWCSSIDADGGIADASSSWRVGVLSGAMMWPNSIRRSYTDVNSGSGTQRPNLPRLSNWGARFHSLYGLQCCPRRRQSSYRLQVSRWVLTIPGH